MTALTEEILDRFDYGLGRVAEHYGWPLWLACRRFEAYQRERRERQATIALALAAFKAGALDGPDFDFIEANPERAGEVLELTRWLAG